MAGIRCLVFALAVALAGPASAAVQANTAGHLAAVDEPQGIRLVDGLGVGPRLSLPGRGQLWELASLDRGWVATASDGGDGIVVYIGDRRTSRRLAAPAPGPAAAQRRAVPLVDRGQLVGLAWLEGSSAGGYGVRVAEFENEGFTDPQWVSRPGAGSQMGLSATVLADGSWLLVWSAFDGSDDEIVAARRIDGEWTTPRRIGRDNRVPDITPAVVATRGGALAAWSRYDGERYRLVRARFEEGAWRESDEREPGLYPAFRGGQDAPILLFFATARRGWSALRLDERGAIVARADAAGPAPSDETPVLEAGEAGVALRSDPAAPAVTAPWKKPR